MLEVQAVEVKKEHDDGDHSVRMNIEGEIEVPARPSYSKLVPGVPYKAGPDGKISKDELEEFFAAQIRKHDEEMALDDMDAIEPHPLLYCKWPALRLVYKTVLAL